MALPPYSAVSLAEFKREHPMTGTGLDAYLQEKAGAWTRAVEGNIFRRLVMRAPTESAVSILGATAWANSTPAVGGQPTSPGRLLVVTFPSTATAGVITITGTVAGVVGQTEAFDVATEPLIQYGVKFFTAVSGIAITGAAGSGNVTVGASLGYVEYHTICPSSCYHRPLEWPVRQVLTVHEDTARVYGASSLLVATTDYELQSPSSLTRRLVRVSGAIPRTWRSDYRAVRDVYSAGYFTLANVPSDIKSVVMELMSWSVRYEQGGRQGMASASDGAGSWVLQGPPFITTQMERRLDAYRRWSVGGAETGTRDFDEEAA